MPRHVALPAALALLSGACTADAQTTNPFPEPVNTDDPVIVNVVEFASVPDFEGAAARMMLLVEEPASGRLFVNDMRGPIYTLPAAGGAATLYVDIDDPRWGFDVEAGGREQGFQSFALHPQFAEPGSPGYGRFYTYTDVLPSGTPDFLPGGGDATHHTVLLEWRAQNPDAAAYDGGPPRVLMRFEQPFRNHNAGHLAFRPHAQPGDGEFGLLYIGVADGGSGGDPLGLAQNRGSAFGKILRIDPLGTNSANGQYGIPANNPFVDSDDTLGEIYALGLRNPQRFGWDAETGSMYVADIGQNSVEEVSPVTAGANLGWNVWEGSFRFVSRSGVDPVNPRSDPAMTYPVVEWGRSDPLMPGRQAATGVVVYRDERIEPLRDRVLFGDFPSGEIFAFDADDPPAGGNQGFRRVLLRTGDAEPVNLLSLIRATNETQGRTPADRTDLRFAEASGGRVFILNKHDGMIREIVPAAR